jgi:hypothetical protein
VDGIFQSINKYIFHYLTVEKGKKNMTRKKKKKRQVRYISHGMSDFPKDEKTVKKVKKHIRKPKMPARIKKNQTHMKKK